MKLISRTTRAGQLAGGWIHGACLAALLFGLLTFAISSFRASLNPETTFALFDAKRIALIAAGAGVFWLAIRAVSRDLPDLRGLTRIAMIAVPGFAVLFAIAVGWDVVIDRRLDDVAARNLRWILLWSGYFGTGVAAWLAVQYAAALAHAQTVTGRVEARSADDGFWVKTGRQTIRIPHDSIEWIEAEGNYARIHGSDSAHGLVRMTLSGIEAELDAADFIRIHRSALCRKSAIRGYRRKPSGAMLALLASGAEAPLGRNYAKVLVEQTRIPASQDELATDDTVTRRRSQTRSG